MFPVGNEADFFRIAMGEEEVVVFDWEDSVVDKVLAGLLVGWLAGWLAGNKGRLK